MEKEKNENDFNSYLKYLKDEDDLLTIYNLIKSKKHSANQIKQKLRNYLNDPEDLYKFLNAILDSKTPKKNETKEATSAGGSAGMFVGPLSGKKIDNSVPTVRENKKKIETKEATSSSSSGQYSQPAIWAKSMSKKNWRGASTKYMPGAKRVQVKDKCKKFPYCNQGDINALKIFESVNVQLAIDNVSNQYGYDKNYISEIVFDEIRKTQNLRYL